MRQVSIQFHPDRALPVIEQRIIAAFQDAIPEAIVKRDNDDGRYFNIGFMCSSPAEALTTIAAVFALEDIGPTAKNACIVVCEGKDGWNDYLLLSHYDRTLICDEV